MPPKCYASGVNLKDPVPSHYYSRRLYANLTFGDFVSRSRGWPDSRIEFKRLPNFEKHARSAAKKISKEAYEDPEELIEFSRMLGVPTTSGPDAWVFVMQKIGSKLERMGIWKHTVRQPIKKSLKMAVQLMLSKGHFGDEVEGLEEEQTPSASR